jgi:hypothetical protein
MRKIFATLAPLTVALAAAVALALPGVAHSATQSTCAANNEWNGGATALLNPGIGVGSTMTESINFTGTLSLGTSGSQVFDRVVVYDTQTAEKLAVGLIKTTSNPQLRTYISVNGTIISQSNANVGTTYGISIDHSGSTSWVVYDGNGNTKLVTGLTAREWFFQTTIDQGSASGTCPNVTAHQLSESPFNFLNQPPWAWSAAVSPYSYTSKTSSGFGFSGS